MKFPTDLERNTMINFSSDTPLKVSNNLLLYFDPLAIHTFSKLLYPYSRFDVTRGFSNNTIELFDSWSSKVSPLSSAYVKRCDQKNGYTSWSFESYNSCIRIHGPPYPLPDSFPPIPGDATGVTPLESRSGIADTSGILPTVEGYTSISTSSAISTMFKDYALLTDKCINRRISAALIHVSIDDLKDLANDLWTIVDNFYSEDSPLEE